MRLTAALLTVTLLAAPAAAAIAPGTAAPDFKLNDATGKVVTLSDYKGKTVVLEWNNPGCPFVQKHYGSGNMQKTQAEATKAGVVWLSINSGAPGKQGYMTGPEANQFVAGEKAHPSAYLLDPKGVVGKGYEAATTPQMYIINASGTIVYSGAIDDKPTADTGDIKTARNHVLAALSELRAGKPVSVAETRSYGCSVKYPET